MKYKFTILALVFLVIPFGSYALFMMYGWLFFSFHFGEEQYVKTMTAVLVAFLGSAIAAYAYDRERLL